AIPPSERNRIIYGLAAEIAFTVLPLVVVLIVVSENGWVRLFASPEWSFGSAILFGQSIVRFFSGLLRGGAAASGPVALTVSLIIVFGLAPSLGILVFTLIEAEKCPLGPPSNRQHWLHIMQVIFFFLSAAAYLILGTVGEIYAQKFSKTGSPD